MARRASEEHARTVSRQRHCARSSRVCASRRFGDGSQLLLLCWRTAAFASHIQSTRQHSETSTRRIRVAFCSPHIGATSKSQQQQRPRHEQQHRQTNECTHARIATTWTTRIAHTYNRTTMSVFLAVLSFIDIVALTFLNGYWVRRRRSCCALPMISLSLLSCSRADHARRGVCLPLVLAHYAR